RSPLQATFADPPDDTLVTLTSAHATLETQYYSVLFPYNFQAFATLNIAASAHITAVQNNPHVRRALSIGANGRLDLNDNVSLAGIPGVKYADLTLGPNAVIAGGSSL